MAGRHHVFVAVVPTAFGEVLVARRLAEALVAGGDAVSFVVPREVLPALAGAPVRKGVLDGFGTPMLDTLLRQLAEMEKCDSVCLVDLAAVALTFAQHGLPIDALRAIDGVVALDLWSLDETDRVFDFGDTRVAVPAAALAIPRMVPVPFARPEATGAYDAWPSNQPLDDISRARARERLGIPLRERLVVMPTAAWQEPDRQRDARAHALARDVPPILLARIADAGASLVHVGPVPWAAPSPRYRHVSQLPPSEFAELIGAAEAVVTANLSATTIATALAAEVPVIAFTSDRFRVWPLGLVDLLRPVFAANPLLDCVRTVDLGDAAGFAAALAPDPAWRARCRAYRARVALLPGPAARYAELVAATRTRRS